MQVIGRLPRLTKGELEGLVKARARIDVVYDLIGKTNLQARPALEALLREIHAPIHEVVERRLRMIQELLNPKSTETPLGGSQESSGGTDQEAPPKTAPGEPEA